jgi:hypothetical protein
MPIRIVANGSQRAAIFACVALIVQILSGTAVRAQHPHPAPPDTARPAPMPSMPGMRMPGDDTVAMAMAMEGTLGISMERMGSGTTWIPDAVSLPARHFMLGEWSVMAHGFAFLQYNAQQGPRGDRQLGSLNWAMLMADRAFAGGRVQLRFMPSLDPWTVGRCGAPLLLQSGETCHGEPLVDRQHPHDLFMELAALYERPLGSRLALLLYAAPAGEPALGPVAFMHRPSAMDEPQVTLGHHWQDATHISFGVLTAGLFTRKVRLEGSVFNGHEPDERRYNFEPIDLNSYSGRLTINPTVNWSLTGGYGYLHNPELQTPDESMHRLTTSAMHGRPLGQHGQWASTLLYGANKHFGHRWTNSLLAESEAILDERNTVFGRVEYTEKTAHDLDLGDFDHDHKFVIESFSLGYIRELVSHSRPLTLGVGVRGTINLIPRDLEKEYGSRTPAGGMIFVRVRPNHAPHTAGADSHRSH